MRVLIRADASYEIGTGHVMRCLTLAEQLRKRKIFVQFLMKNLPGNMIDHVQSKGFEVVDSFQPVDICIIDHYEVDKKWEREIRPYVKKLIVIDDLANREHDCDILLDQNLIAGFTTRYDGLVPESCKKLLGPDFYMLREEFFEERKRLRKRTGMLERLLIFLGGSDPTGETMKVLKALDVATHPFSQIDVVTGKSNKKNNQIEMICKKNGYRHHCQIDYLAELMHQADFSIGTGGSTSIERAFLGLPSSITIVAENQIDATKELAKHQVAWNLGWYETVTELRYVELLNTLVNHQDELKYMSEKALELTNNIRSIDKLIDIFLEDFI